MAKTIFLTLFLLSCFAIGYSQIAIQIYGRVTDGANVAIPSASVVLKERLTGKILAFSRTDENGRYEILWDSNLHTEKLIVSAKHLSYRTDTISFSSPIFQYDFKLAAASELLEEVVVERRNRLSQKGDTLDYDVSAFTKDMDRSVEDVLKRMPGIAVSEDGEIRFNDTPISNFYIDGDDLLGGKYVLGSRTIPHDLIEKVQVLTNHEHIKINKGPLRTNAVALNLVVKDSAKASISGTADLSSGLPANYDAEINTILLHKNVKMLNVLKGNNVGKDVTADVLDMFVSSTDDNRLLSSSTLAPPMIRKSRYFMNNSGTFIATNSHRFGNDIFTRSNVRYAIQENTFQNSGESQVLLQSDTVNLLESQRGRKRSQKFGFDLFAEKNRNNYYFGNDLKIDVDIISEYANLRTYQDEFDQSLRTTQSNLSNQFHFIPRLKDNRSMEMFWNFNISQAPQKLRLPAGLFSSTDLMIPVNFEEIQQYAKISEIKNNVGLWLKFTGSKYERTYGLNYTQKNEKLVSFLDAVDAASFSAESTNAVASNDMEWKENDISVFSRHKISFGKLQMDVHIPIGLLQVALADKPLDYNSKQYLWQFEPSINFDYQFDQKHSLVAVYNRTNSYNAINSLYQNNIVLNHRTIQKNENSEILGQLDHSWNLTYRFKDPLLMFFGTAEVFYDLSARRFLNDLFIADGIQRQSQFMYANTYRSYGTSVQLSKYISSLGITVTARPRWSRSMQIAAAYGELYRIANHTFSLVSSMDVRVFNAIDLSANVEYNALKNNLIPLDVGIVPSKTSNKLVKNNIRLSYSPLPEMQFAYTFNAIHIRQQDINDVNTYFMDFTARYKLSKWKSEINLDILNIANIAYFTTFVTSSTGYIINRYSLNPRMINMRYIFRF